jgi:formylglycine-generating enzyme required for sulfatase activity
MGVFDRKGKIIIPIEFPSIRCVGDCDKDILFEISDIGLKAICVTKELDKVYAFQKVTPTLVAGRTEISVKDWFAYVKDVKDNGFNYNYGFEETIPDTSKVEAKLLPAYRAFIKGMEMDDVTGVKTHYGFAAGWKIEHQYDSKLDKNKMSTMIDFPVTGITYKQAQRYTEWLTIIYKEKIMVDEDVPYEIVFRLPKIDEWEKMASAGLNTAMQKNNVLDSINKEGCMLLNFNSSSGCKNYEDYLKYSFGKGSAFVTSFFPDNNGIYNLFGNVAEMVYENGLAKGGSYKDFAKDAVLTKTIEYEEAEPWLGFRVVGEFKAK